MTPDPTAVVEALTWFDGLPGYATSIHVDTLADAVRFLAWAVRVHPDSGDYVSDKFEVAHQVAKAIVAMEGE